MKIIVLNHKMNLYYEELEKYIKQINKINKNLIIAPSNIYLTEFLNNCIHQVASQDICYISEGNHTGKVSWKQMKHLGIKYTIIGHNEKNDDINKINEKLNVCIENDITPILCFGNKNKEENIIKLLEKIKISNISKIIFAYEPIFNISSPNVDIEYIENKIETIYNYLFEKYQEIPFIIYGGGINKDNINDIYNIDKIKGILLGGISSNIDELTKILFNINEK